MKTMWNVIVVGVVMAGCAGETGSNASRNSLTGPDAGQSSAAELCDQAAAIRAAVCGVVDAESVIARCRQDLQSTPMPAARTSADGCLRLDTDCRRDLQSNVEYCVEAVEGFVDCHHPFEDCLAEQQQVRVAELCHFAKGTRAVTCDGRQAEPDAVSQCMAGFPEEETVREFAFEHVVRCLQSDHALCEADDAEAIRSCLQRVPAPVE